MATDNKMTEFAGPETEGVERLISRLRDQGIAHGKGEADKLIAEAKRQAAEIVSDARRHADQVRAEASKDTEKLRAAGEDAIRQASRDTMLSLEEDLTNRFRLMLQRLVKGALDDPGLLQRMILEVAGKAAPSVEHAQVLLPSTMVSREDLQRKPEQAKPGTLTHFVLAVAGDMLREGVSVGVTDGIGAGIRIKLIDEQLQIDLTETTISELLLLHLLPRFRAVLRGAVATSRPAPSVARPQAERPAP